MITRHHMILRDNNSVLILCIIQVAVFFGQGSRSHTVIEEIFVRLKISYSSVIELSDAINFCTTITLSHTLVCVHDFRVLLRTCRFFSFVSCRSRALISESREEKKIVDHVDLHCRFPCTQWSVITVDLRLHMLAQWISFHCQTVTVKSLHCCRVACALDSEQQFCGCKLSVEILFICWVHGLPWDVMLFLFSLFVFFLSPSRIDFAFWPWRETKKKKTTRPKCTMINFCFSSGFNEQTYARVRKQKNKALKIYMNARIPTHAVRFSVS